MENLAQFEDSLYGESWLEGKPELFIRMSQSGKVVHQTKTKRPSWPRKNNSSRIQGDTIQSGL